MQRVWASVVASVAFLWSSAALALPSSPFIARAEMVAKVTGVSARGELLDDQQNYVRDFSIDELSLLPFNVGDTLTVRWEVHSDDIQDCGPEHRYFIFGGIGAGGRQSAGPCAANRAAEFSELRRANGDVSSVLTDAWESAEAYGPLFDTVEGKVVPEFSPTDGLVVDCCVYLYLPGPDRIVSFGGNGSEGEISWPVQYFRSIGFGETGGGGFMEIYPSQMFGWDEYEDPETGEWHQLGWLQNAFFNVEFDVQWTSSMEILDVPEPGALGLFGVGLLAAGGLARKSSRRTR